MSVLKKRGVKLFKSLVESCVLFKGRRGHSGSISPCDPSPEDMGIGTSASLQIDNAQSEFQRLWKKSAPEVAFEEAFEHEEREVGFHRDISSASSPVMGRNNRHTRQQDNSEGYDEQDERDGASSVEELAEEIREIETNTDDWRCGQKRDTKGVVKRSNASESNNHQPNHNNNYNKQQQRPSAPKRARSFAHENSHYPRPFTAETRSHSVPEDDDVRKEKIDGFDPLKFRIVNSQNRGQSPSPSSFSAKDVSSASGEKKMRGFTMTQNADRQPTTRPKAPSKMKSPTYDVMEEQLMVSIEQEYKM